MSILSFLQRYKNVIILVIITLLTASVFIPQLGDLVDAIKELGEADLRWVLLAIILFYAGVPVFAYQISWLTFKKLPYKLTLQVQAATLFVNKILPQGVGTISLNIYYFIKKGHTPNQAATIMAVNATMNLVSYTALIIFAMFTSDLSTGGLLYKPEINASVSVLVVGAIIALFAYLLSLDSIRKKVHDARIAFLQNITHYRHRPKALLGNLVCSTTVSSLNVLTLMCCAQAVGIDVSFADALLAYTFGNVAAALVPTPGGLGSAEMGIYTGLSLVGVESSLAMSVTLLYRFVSYWLSIIPGGYFFHRLKKTLFAGYSAKKEAKTAL